MASLEEQFRAQPIMNKQYQRKKLIGYLIRTAIAAVLYWYFWSFSWWVPFSLWFYIPLNLAGLFMIVIMPRLLEAKMQKAKQRMDDAQAIDIEGEIVDD
jgi:hypothetical protein